MAKNSQGHFVVSEIESGRFVAVATNAPFFCLEAESEEAAVEKVKRAVTFCQSLTVESPIVGVHRQSVTSIRDGRSYNVKDILEAA